LLNISTGAIDFLYDNDTDRPAGHGDLGTGTIVGWDRWASGITKRNLATWHNWIDVLLFRDSAGNTDWTFDFHGSMLADNEDWMAVGMVNDPRAVQPAGCCIDYHVFEDEIIQVSTDGSQKFRRLAHTRVRTDNPDAEYWAVPKPTISKDGRFIAFTSNWEKTTGRYDLFIVRIPPAPVLH
jgi:hypothetical protein